MKKKILESIEIVLILFISVSCKFNTSPKVDYKILSPKENWYYTDSEKILFSCNVNEDKLEWYSSIDGFLGNGPELFSELTSGNHEIFLQVSGRVLNKKVFITVNTSEKKELNCKLFNDFPVNFESVTKNFALFTTDCTVSNLEISNNKEATDELSKKIFDCIRDVKINNVKFNKPVLNKKTEIKNTVSYYINNSDTVIKEKTFYVMNTQNQYEADEVQGELFYSSTTVDIYLEKNEFEENIYENIRQCINNFENIILKRLSAVWGDYSDVNADGKITVLFSSTINKQKVAVGFFNQNDFFINIQDAENESYNPYSNEMDIIYLAIPDEENFNYSVNSVSATLAHEMTHLINFSNTTFTKIQNKEQYIGMELFLDEGLSHLSECLCGFCESGGNSFFINSYLKDSINYSVCSSDVFGNSDSPQKRGAACLLLYWLFQKAGGIRFSNGGTAIDAGGIDYLQCVLQNYLEGFDALGIYFKKPMDILFKEFCSELFTKRMSEIFDFNFQDPITKEKFFMCEEFSKYSVPSYKNIFKIQPYSFALFENVENKNLELNCKTVAGNFYLLY